MVLHPFLPYALLCVHEKLSLPQSGQIPFPVPHVTHTTEGSVSVKSAAEKCALWGQSARRGFQPCLSPADWLQPIISTFQALGSSSGKWE
jgi:hypothetical protein